MKRTIKFANIFARMNEMLWCRRGFLVGPTIDGVFERATFAVCLRVVHLEPHLLDNTGPLTRDTAVRFGVSFDKDYPLLCQIGMRHRGHYVFYLWCIFHRRVARVDISSIG